MDLLRSRAISKARMVICLTNIIMGVLYALNLSRNGILIPFARLPAFSQLLRIRRNKPTFFACNSAECGLLWIYLCLCLYEPISTPQVCKKLARLDRLRNCARYPGNVCQYGIYEQIIKSCQNQGQILRKSYFDFSCGKSIYRPVSKNLHYILAKQKAVADRQNQLPLFNQSSARDNYIYI